MRKEYASRDEFRYDDSAPEGSQLAVGRAAVAEVLASGACGDGDISVLIEGHQNPVGVAWPVDAPADYLSITINRKPAP